MTFTEFMSILNGEYKETAGTTAKSQCVDLANAYIKYVLILPIIEWTNAVDFPSKAGDNYDYILNTPEGVPQEGDLVIWDGRWGHIAVFIEGDANRFTSFDQNYPTGSPCHVQEHDYTSPKVLGWLRPKQTPQTPSSPSQPILNDQTKYDFGGNIGIQELGAVRSIINDLKNKYVTSTISDTPVTSYTIPISLANFPSSTLFRELVRRVLD